MTKYTINDFLGGRVRLKQPVEGLRATSDAVLLSAVCNPKPGDTILDVGCGTGVVALCIAAALLSPPFPREGKGGFAPSMIHLTGIDIQPDLADLARENAELNNQNMLVIDGDVGGKIPVLTGQTFNHVVTNPPFYTEDPTRENASQEMAYKETVPLKTWIGFCLKHLKPRGTFSIIHRPESIPDILEIITGKLGGIVLIPIWPKPGATPKRVIIQGILGAKKPFRIHPGIMLHNPDNTRTDLAESLMRHGQKIIL